MRTGFVVVGVVLVILGAVLMLVPLVPQASVTVSQSTPYVANITGFSITGTVAGTMTWTSNSTVDFGFGTCSKISASDSCTGTTQGWESNSSGGSISFTVATGGAIAAVVIGSGSASVNIKLAETTIGIIVLVVGILLLVLGVVLRTKESPALSSPQPNPANGTTEYPGPVLK